MSYLGWRHRFSITPLKDHPSKEPVLEKGHSFRCAGARPALPGTCGLDVQGLVRVWPGIIFRQITQRFFERRQSPVGPDPHWSDHVLPVDTKSKTLVRWRRIRCDISLDLRVFLGCTAGNKHFMEKTQLRSGAFVSRVKRAFICTSFLSYIQSLRTLTRQPPFPFMDTRLLTGHPNSPLCPHPPSSVAV